jgi:hypothetical protein
MTHFASSTNYIVTFVTTQPHWLPCWHPHIIMTSTSLSKESLKEINVWRSLSPNNRSMTLLKSRCLYRHQHFGQHTTLPTLQTPMNDRDLTMSRSNRPTHSLCYKGFWVLRGPLLVSSTIPLVTCITHKDTLVAHYPDTWPCHCLPPGETCGIHNSTRVLSQGPESP